MQGYWISFTDGTAGYCEGQSPYDAVLIAEKLTSKTAVVGGTNKYDPKLEALPYPARPVIWQFDHPVSGKCPAFCTSPRECKGRTSCPKSRACDD